MKEYFSGVLFMLALVVTVWALEAHCEASAYNRITGKHVSTWDAMFVELRVQEAAK